MMTGARSEETGQDYEHLELLLAKFQEFKLRVQAGEDKYKVCESLARRLEASQEVQGTQARITQEWMALIEAIQDRDNKLESAGDIHRFNRDVYEALSRIAEKSAIISSKDMGRDLKAVQSLIRKHEAFENDLVALEAQLQVLIDDSASLQSRYPDKNGSQIAKQQQILLGMLTNRLFQTSTNDH